MAKRAKVERRRRNKVNSYLRESALGENTGGLVSIVLIKWFRIMIAMMVMKTATEDGEVKQGACASITVMIELMASSDAKRWAVQETKNYHIALFLRLYLIETL